MPEIQFYSCVYFDTSICNNYILWKLFANNTLKIILVSFYKAAYYFDMDIAFCPWASKVQISVMELGATREASMQQVLGESKTAINESVTLVRARATKDIVLSDGYEANPTVLKAGDIFWVNVDPMPGLKGLIAHYKDESFFVESTEFSILAN